LTEVVLPDRRVTLDPTVIGHKENIGLSLLLLTGALCNDAVINEKEASDMVLLDDNFATIVSAVKEGRRIYDNIRKFVKYILTGNTGEIVVMLIGSLLGMPLPLLPIQILWIDLVTDGTPAIAFGYEEAEQKIMGRSPIDPKEGIFARGLGWQILVMGSIVGLISVSAGYWFQVINLICFRTVHGYPLLISTDMEYHSRHISAVIR
jgi:magnesium-transporting ATPase (P-type)